MNIGKKGFTLIELLVVVLIIGILAAIALPQYQMAVIKTKTMEAISFSRAVENAADIYYLANDDYPETLDSLFNDMDITFSCPQYFSCGYSKGWLVLTSSYGYSIQNRFLFFGGQIKNIFYCLASGSHPEDRGNAICKAITGVEPIASGPGNQYFMKK
jgi:prepilin-type N-terminal cleavage/methylation domain-containing protein